MSTFNLLQNVTAVQQPWSRANPPPDQSVVDLHNVGGGTPFGGANYQSLQATVTGSGTVAATVVWMVSNNRIDWTPYPTINGVVASPLTIASAASPNTGIVNGTGSFSFYAAYVSAISGTGAAVNAWLSA